MAQVNVTIPGVYTVGCEVQSPVLDEDDQNQCKRLKVRQLTAT